MARIAAAALLAAVAVAGCGGGGDDGPSGATAPERDRAPADTAAQLVARADAAMKQEDFDGALALLRRAGDDPSARQRLPRYRATAARTMLRTARRRYAETVRRKESPRPALSLARNSLKYQETPAARRFYTRMKREVAAFKRAQGAASDDDDQAGGGPPPHARGDGE